MMAAVLSSDGRYRYSLTRGWNLDLPYDLWIMCNPSTADHSVDDPTITRCIGFSRRFYSGGFNVVNAYGYRATKPADLWAAKAAGIDIVGPKNDLWIRTHLMMGSSRVIVAWGLHPKPERVRAVLDLIHDAGHKALCLGVTKDGQPRHPLMLRSTTELQEWSQP